MWGVVVVVQGIVVVVVAVVIWCCGGPHGVVVGVGVGAHVGNNVVVLGVLLKTTPTQYPQRCTTAVVVWEILFFFFFFVLFLWRNVFREEPDGF